VKHVRAVPGKEPILSKTSRPKLRRDTADAAAAAANEVETTAGRMHQPRENHNLLLSFAADDAD